MKWEAEGFIPTLRGSRALNEDADWSGKASSCGVDRYVDDREAGGCSSKVTSILEACMLGICSVCLA